MEDKEQLLLELKGVLHFREGDVVTITKRYDDVYNYQALEDETPVEVEIKERIVPGYWAYSGDTLGENPVRYFFNEDSIVAPHPLRSIVK